MHERELKMALFEYLQMVMHLSKLLQNGQNLQIAAKWPKFTDEPRNVRISLATDGVNPFGELCSIYLVWPIFFINNKIPPWMSIKRENIMLIIIIPGICLH
jgi:hypothetical protein